MSRRQPMNLAFGAEVSEMRPATSACVRDVDGNEYDFRKVDGTQNEIGKLMAAAFVLGQSKNSRALTRKSSNRSFAGNVRSFVNWASERPDQTFSQDMVVAYRSAAYSRGAASTAYGKYGCVAQCAAVLMERGLVDRFPIPKNASSAAVDASKGNAGSTLAHALSGAEHSGGADDFNEAALSAWVGAAWNELETLFARIRRAKDWRAEDPLKPDLDELGAKEAIASMSRVQVLSLCKSICLSHLPGQRPPTIVAMGLPSPIARASWERVLRIICWEASYAHLTPVDSEAICVAMGDPDVGTMAIPAWARPDMQLITESEDDSAKRLVRLMHRRFGGFPCDPKSSARMKSLEDDEARMICRLRARAVSAGHKLSIPDLSSYFHPSPAMVGLAISLLASAHVNAASAAELAVDCLLEDDRPGMRRLAWRKGRAGGDQPALPFPMGGERARTIPRLIESFIEASSELRAQAEQSQRGQLFLWTRGDGLKTMDDHVRVVSVWANTRAHMKGVGRTWTAAESTKHMLRPIAEHVDSITPSLLRRTAINIANARLDRDFGSTAKMDGRVSAQTLETSYLSNEQTRNHLDAQIRQGQAALADWLRSEPIVLPADPSSIAATLNVDAEMAERIACDDLNLGMGASLVDGRAVFIDTPFNALRTIQWLRELAGARDRMLRDNPGRWRASFEPQISLFEDALRSFSRKSSAEAKRLDKDHKLPFPPIH